VPNSRTATVDLGSTRRSAARIRPIRREAPNRRTATGKGAWVMIVGVPKELKDHEYRVAATPGGVGDLTAAGHRVLVEQGAGAGSYLADEEFVRAGAEIVASADDVWAEADLVLKVKEPIPAEYPRMRAGQVLFTFLHLAASRECTEAVLSSGVTAVGYETVELASGELPLLAPMSEVAGRMAPQVGAHLLERESGGRGVLLGGVSGVPPATVVVLGGGIAGSSAARIARGMEAEVILLDNNARKLREIDLVHQGRIQTVMSNRLNVERAVLGADLVVGAVLITGARAPKLVEEDLVRQMRPGSVIVDISVDQGGCIATSHVTTHSEPTYVKHGVVHYCVGNMPGAVPRTSTYALANVTLPYALAIANLGLEAAVRTDQTLARGVNAVGGALTNEPVAMAHGMSSRSLAELIPGVK